MRKIAGPGHVSNGWVDYDPNTNPLGTVFTADWGNDVQNELIGIQAEMGIAEAAGTNKYVLAAIKGLMIKLRKDVGEFFMRGGDIKAPAAFDKDDPESFFPAVCLDNINTYVDIAAANWPDLVPELRTWTLKYLDGLTGAASAYILTTWAIATNVATLTFANNAANDAAIASIAEIFATTGDYPVVNVASTIGNIPAGNYRITGVSTVARTITFACTASNGTNATTNTVTFYTNRLADSESNPTTSARLYGAKGMAVISAGTALQMSGAVARDFMQGHLQDRPAAEATAGRGFATASASNVFGNPAAGSSSIIPVNVVNATGSPVTDGINGTPRTGTTTRPRSITGHLYIWAGSYIAP